MIKTRISCCVLVCLLAVTAIADETVSFTAIPSQGAAGLMSYNATLTGGFSMGALDWAGIATQIEAFTYGSELFVDMSGPLGAATLQLGTGTTFPPATPFAGSSNTFLGAGDPAGNWTFDFYESFDDGTANAPDATWNSIDFTFKNLQPFVLLETYTDMSSFSSDLAVSPAALMENFNTYTYGSFTGLTLPLSNANFSAVISASSSTLYSGNGDMSTNLAGDSLIIDVSGSPTPVTMIGGDFYGGDILGVAIPAEITIMLQNGATEVFTTSTSEFRGFRADPSTPISQILISSEDPNGIANAWPTVDNLKIGVAVVPEPTSLGIWALVAAMACFRRR